MVPLAGITLPPASSWHYHCYNMWCGFSRICAPRESLGADEPSTAEAPGLGEHSLKNMRGKGGACCLSCLTHDTCWYTCSHKKMIWLMRRRGNLGPGSRARLLETGFWE